MNSADTILIELIKQRIYDKMARNENDMTLAESVSSVKALVDLAVLKAENAIREERILCAQRIRDVLQREPVIAIELQESIAASNLMIKEIR